MLANLRVRSPVIIALLACAILLPGCSLLSRPKKSPEAAYAERPVDQLYAAGADRLDRHLWADGITYFKEVERQHPYSEWSRRAIMMQAFAHYEANQYDDAIADADRFIQLYPGNASTAYAYYLKAECYFEQILDVGRDQAATEQALSGMREVARRYPKTEYATDARLKIDMINDQLAGKEMSVGRWYLRQGDTLSAIGRFKTVVEKFQTTSDAPEALYRLVEAYLTLGVIEEANRNAAVLGYNFPGDVWYADAYRLMTAKGLRPAVEPRRATASTCRASHVLSLQSAPGTRPCRRPRPRRSSRARLRPRPARPRRPTPTPRRRRPAEEERRLPLALVQGAGVVGHPGVHHAAVQLDKRRKAVEPERIPGDPAAMLIGLAIRDVVLIETLDLAIGPGLTALTGETGAGKSIILDALGLATGARADAGLVRRGAAQAQATAIFALPAITPSGPIWKTRVSAARPTRIWCCAASSAPMAARAPSSTTRRPASGCCAIWAPSCWRCMASTRPSASWTRAPTARCWTPSAPWPSRRAR